MKGQSIAAKPLRISGFGKFSNAGDVSFEVCPAQLQGAFAIAEISLLGVCRNEKGDMRFGNRVIRIGEAVAGHFSTTERGERRDRG